MGTPRWAVGMQKLTAGVYMDSDGALHFDLYGMCVENGYAPTRENGAMLEKVAREAAEKLAGHVCVEHVEDDQ